MPTVPLTGEAVNAARRDFQHRAAVWLGLDPHLVLSVRDATESDGWVAVEWQTGTPHAGRHLEAARSVRGDGGTGRFTYAVHLDGAEAAAYLAATRPRGRG